MAQERREILIKQYGGTRLYDTAALRYVVLTDLAEMIVRGERFIVCDAASGEDITRDILNRLQ